MLKTVIIVVAVIWGGTTLIGLALLVGSRYSKRIRTFFSGN